MARDHLNPPKLPLPQQTALPNRNSRLLYQPGPRPARLVSPTVRQLFARLKYKHWEQQAPRVWRTSQTNSPRARVYSRVKTTSEEKQHLPKILARRAINKSIFHDRWRC